MPKDTPESDFHPHTSKPCGIDPNTDCRAIDAMAEMLRICRRIETSLTEVKDRMAKGDTNFALIEQWKLAQEAKIAALEAWQKKADEQKEAAMSAIIGKAAQWIVFLIGIVGVIVTVVLNLHKATP